MQLPSLVSPMAKHIQAPLFRISISGAVVTLPNLVGSLPLLVVAITAAPLAPRPQKVRVELAVARLLITKPLLVIVGVSTPPARFRLIAPRLSSMFPVESETIRSPLLRATRQKAELPDGLVI